ncbi:phosducin-like protein [Anneissia japonica]|uniref:phosducin-like protein n=1 Tax=Anneissia japonica TaxID=1529436 RepID=UPI001425A6A9|nr:phosducin-like protein [Anneissia japonica]XP_033118193.1 phosducin-like protein [Anneissia japonica]
MATLDDKLLGEKKQYYYSSSEDEGGQASDEEQTKDEATEKQAAVKEPVFIPNDELGSRSATKTGPKGVIADWRRYKQLENEKREQQEAERKALHKKLALTCRSHLDEEESKKKEAEHGVVLDDEFLRKYREERLREMRIASQHSPTFGKVVNLEGDEYVDAIDNENAMVTVMVHIYLDNIAACNALNGCFHCLAKEYPKVKFCTVRADKVQVSKSFSTSALPALLIYRGGNVIGNFVRVSDELGEDFYSVDLEAFLQQHSLLPSKEEQEMLTSSIRCSSKDGNDSDLELD